MLTTFRWISSVAGSRQLDDMQRGKPPCNLNAPAPRSGRASANEELSSQRLGGEQRERGARGLVGLGCSLGPLLHKVEYPLLLRGVPRISHTQTLRSRALIELRCEDGVVLPGTGPRWR